MWDLRELDFAQMDASFQRRLISARNRYPVRERARIAYVVAGELGFGMTRMYENLAGVSPELNRIFHDHAEAERWLLETD